MDASADQKNGPGPAGEKIPEKMGHYQIKELLGRGGMAIVYKGIQPSLNREVAIKVLPQHMAGRQDLIARFERESSIIAGLTHPNIIQIIDRGIHEDHYYIVMEYLGGSSLDGIIEKKQLPIYQVVNIALQVARAMEYAHSKGVIHRDIKPANVLLSSDYQAVKITDFGIAHLAEFQYSAQTLTNEQTSLGTLDYMSPEQRRDSRLADARSDIYSFGVLLYETVTGHLPLGRFRNLQEQRDDSPPLLDEIVLRCLQEDPRYRYPSFAEVIADLEKLSQKQLAYHEALAKVASSARQLSRRARTALLEGGPKGARWKRISLAAVAALVLLSGITLGLVRLLGRQETVPAGGTGSETLTTSAPAPSLSPAPVQPAIPAEAPAAGNKAVAPPPPTAAPAATSPATASSAAATSGPEKFAQVDAFIAGKEYSRALPVLKEIRTSADAAGNVADAAEAQWRLARVYLELGNRLYAGNAYAHYADTYGSSEGIVGPEKIDEALYQVAVIKTDTRNYREAMEVLKRHSERFPSSPRAEEVLYRMENILDDQFKPVPQGIEEYRGKLIRVCLDFLERFPQSRHTEEIQWRLANVYLDTGRVQNFAQTVELLEDMARRFPESSYLPLFKAAEISRTKLGDKERARQLYEAFLAARPASSKAEEARYWLSRP